MEVPIENPLFQHLWRLDPDDAPNVRMAAVLAAYQQSTGIALAEPLSVADQEILRLWLLKQEDDLPQDENSISFALLSKKVPRLAYLAHAEAAGKAGWLQQAPCITCTYDPQRSPLRISFSVRTRPFSAQSLSAEDLKTVKSKIADTMRGRFEVNDWNGHELCVRVVAVVGVSDRKKDVDNLVKGLLDSLQGSIYEKDSFISHLSINRFRHTGDEGFYGVSVQPVMNSLDDVVLKEVRVGWLGRPEITI